MGPFAFSQAPRGFGHAAKVAADYVFRRGRGRAFPGKYPIMPVILRPRAGERKPKAPYCRRPGRQYGKDKALDPLRGRGRCGSCLRSVEIE